MTRFFLFVGMLAFGFGTEFVEHARFQNDIEWMDVLVDSVGVVFGSVIAWVSAPSRG
jgi:hypothetical protein